MLIVRDTWDLGHKASPATTSAYSRAGHYLDRMQGTHRWWARGTWASCWNSEGRLRFISSTEMRGGSGWFLRSLWFGFSAAVRWSWAPLPIPGASFTEPALSSNSPTPGSIRFSFHPTARTSYIGWGLVQNKNARPLIQILMRISRQRQQSIKSNIRPF